MILQEIPPLVVANQYSVGHLPGGRVMQLVLLMDIVTDWLTWTCGTLRLTRLIHSPSVAAAGLSEGYWAWPVIGWCHHYGD